MKNILFDELKKLNLPEDKFAIFGSGPLAIRGIREAKDLDIIVKKDVWDNLSKKYSVQGEKNNLIKIGCIEIWKDWLSLSDKVDKMIDNCEIIEGLPFVRLEYVLKWKKLMQREKDVRDIKLIEEFLKNTNKKLEIKGFVPTSLVDWDGKVVSVIFLAGCNFKCGYCSNKDLVLGYEKLKTISFDKIKEYLVKNKEFVDGVVITGGEPTIHKDFPELCEKIKDLGFKVKIDTNGTNPEMLKELLDKKLVYYVAMDIKTSFGKYKEIINSDVDIKKIKESISIVAKFPKYEFRVTLFPGISKEDLIEIAEYLKKENANKAFFIHQFRNDECLNQEYEKIKPYTKEKLNEFLDLIKGNFEKAGIRNA